MKYVYHGHEKLTIYGEQSTSWLYLSSHRIVQIYICKKCLRWPYSRLTQIRILAKNLVTFVIVTRKVPSIEEEPSYYSSYHSYQENGYNHCCYWKTWPQGSY